MTARAAAILILVCASALNLSAVDTVSGRVVGGTLGPATAFPEVVRIQTTGGVNQFTGILISPIHVLTAASAVTDTTGTITFTPGGSVAVIGGQQYGIFSVTKNPLWVGEGVGNANAFQTGNPDIAILVLSQRVTAVRPAPIYRKPPIDNQPIVVAGFGLQGTGMAGETAASNPAAGQIVSGNTTIDTVATDYYRWTFTTGEADTASGEEGAPSFIVENGVRYIAGVATIRTSAGAGHVFGTVTQHARVDASAAFIDSVLGASACDLLPISLTAPSVVRNVPGEQITVSINVRNQNPTNAAVAFSASVYFSTDLNVSTNDILIGNIAFPSGLAPNTTTLATATFNVPAGLAAGTYFVVALVDAALVNQQTDYQNDSTNGLPVPQVQVTGNTAPTVTSAATASVLQAFVDEQIVFSAGATDVNNDPLAYTWNFGDGTFGSGASVSHTFATAGTYNVIVTISDNFTGSVTSTVTVTVLPLGTIEVIPSKFKLNFTKLGTDTISIGLRDKTVFVPAVEGKAIELSLGQDVLDSGTIVKSKAKGTKGGKFSISTSTGTLKYTSTRRDLRLTLARYGAQNGDLFINVPVSVILKIGTTQYGAQVPFFYKAKANRSGQGKF